MSNVKTAWVSGVTGFWGKNVVLSLLRLNWRVVALSPCEPKDLLSWSRSQDKELVWFPLDYEQLDLSKMPEVPEAFFNCACAFDDDLERMMYINTIAPVKIIEHILPIMKDKGEGNVAVFLGQNGRLGLPRLGKFSASQAGLWTWAEAESRSLKGAPVSLTLVFPPRAVSNLQQNLARQLSKPPRISGLPNADSLVHSVLKGDRRAGRRPWLAGLNTLTW